ncbi:MAG: hypothetical protein E7171_08470 [Firmicutes bacterium]|nr:hypothetical protein [Bacillota bacterium]
MVKIFDRENKYKTILVILLFVFFLAVAISVIASNVEFEKKPEGVIATVLNEGDLVVSYNDGNLINIVILKYILIVLVLQIILIIKYIIQY